MVAYKWKVMHVEDDKLNLFRIRNNNKAYPRVENCGENYGYFIPYDG